MKTKSFAANPVGGSTEPVGMLEEGQPIAPLL